MVLISPLEMITTTVSVAYLFSLSVLGFVKATSPNPEASNLATEVNAARRQEYEKISKQNGQSVDTVGRIAAGEIAKKLGK
jgi:uncharacterized protein YdbL (DUF1318 family)